MCVKLHSVCVTLHTVCEITQCAQKYTYSIGKNPLSWKILHWRRGQRGRLISAVALSGTGDHYHHHPGRQRRSINSERGWTPHLGWNCQLWKCSLCTGTLSLYFPLSDSFWAISSESQFLRQPWLILCPWNLKIKYQIDMIQFLEFQQIYWCQPIFSSEQFLICFGLRTLAPNTVSGKGA